MTKTASTAAPLHPLLADRWSPRSFDPEARVSEAGVVALLEAAFLVPVHTRRSVCGASGRPLAS